MRRLFLELYYKQTFPPHQSRVSLHSSYIVVTCLMLGFEKDFSCHSHLGPIRIPPLFSFPSAPFPRNEKEDGTLELYYCSAYCLPKILLLQLVGHRVIQIIRVFRGFPMLQLLYQCGQSGIDRLNIPLRSLVLKSHPAVVGTARKIQPLHLLHCPQPFLVPLLKQNGFTFFYRFVISFRSYLCLQLRSRLVHKVIWPILLRNLNSIVFQEC